MQQNLDEYLSKAKKEAEADEYKEEIENTTFTCIKKTNLNLERK